jgi:hypothetical protein
MRIPYYWISREVCKSLEGNRCLQTHKALNRLGLFLLPSFRDQLINRLSHHLTHAPHTALLPFFRG